MLKEKKLFIMGAGNMAEAMLQGLLKSKKMFKESIFISEVVSERRDYIAGKHHVHSFENNRQGADWADIVLFAVKPQNIDEVLTELAGVSIQNKVFISIAAGIPISRFVEKLGANARVIRVMPNMPALIGAGISGLSRGLSATPEDELLAIEIMSSVGNVVQLPEESLDAVTAISGSGPAYVFYIMEALREAGVRLGLDAKICEKLVQSTVLGAALLVEKTNESLESLRQKVTSRGGTTEAAIRVFDENDLKGIISRGVEAAEKRAKELRVKS